MLQEKMINGRMVSVEEQLRWEEERKAEYARQSEYMIENWFWRRRMPEIFRKNPDAMKMAEGWKEEGLKNAEIIERLWALEDDFRRSEAGRIEREKRLNQECAEDLAEESSLYKDSRLETGHPYICDLSSVL